jgi:hypothetical protein
MPRRKAKRVGQLREGRMPPADLLRRYRGETGQSAGRAKVRLIGRNELSAFTQEEELQVCRSDLRKLDNQLLRHGFFVLKNGLTHTNRERVADITFVAAVISSI